MARYKRFTFLCDHNERHAIEALADQLQRSQSDAVRWAVREVARNPDILPNKPAPRPPLADKLIDVLEMQGAQP